MSHVTWHGKITEMVQYTVYSDSKPSYQIYSVWVNIKTCESGPRRIDLIPLAWSPQKMMKQGVVSVLYLRLSD
jgi:hypothetical protein